MVRTLTLAILTLQAQNELEITTGNINRVISLLILYVIVLSRCLCGHCQPMPDTARESVCCKEIDKINDLLVSDPLPSCITAHPEFANACLNRTMINIAFHAYRHNYGISDVPSA